MFIFEHEDECQELFKLFVYIDLALIRFIEQVFLNALETDNTIK
jgi:hypothetical protein